jgi:hypothetical protein
MPPARDGPRFGKRRSRQRRIWECSRFNSGSSNKREEVVEIHTAYLVITLLFALIVSYSGIGKIRRDPHLVRVLHEIANRFPQPTTLRTRNSELSSRRRTSSAWICRIPTTEAFLEGHSQAFAYFAGAISERSTGGNSGDLGGGIPPVSGCNPGSCRASHQGRCVLHPPRSGLLEELADDYNSQKRKCNWLRKRPSCTRRVARLPPWRGGLQRSRTGEPEPDARSALGLQNGLRPTSQKTGPAPLTKMPDEPF